MQRLLILSVLPFPFIFATCHYGPPCTKNSECDENFKCFFGDHNVLGTGNCCDLNDSTANTKYFNNMFTELVEDPNARIPAELFYAQREETCESSIDCMHSEVCMVSREKGNVSEIPRILRFNETNQIKKHCYKKSSYWTQEQYSNTLEFCNSNSDCSNNFCLKLGVLIKTVQKIIWKSEQLIIYSPIHFSREKKIMKNAKIILKLRDDEVGAYSAWHMEIDGTDLYYWKKLHGCQLLFLNSKTFFDAHLKNSYRIPRATIFCDEQDYETLEDVEIFGKNLTTQSETSEFEGLCGHPGLKCQDCLVDDGKLFSCRNDTDCYGVGDRDWTNRNLKSYCSNETYNGERLCKREQFTCPPDSLNSDGTGKCEKDEDCVGMDEYTELPDLNATYYPHCFNGFCCARQILCNNHDYPYALPVEFNTQGYPSPCFHDDDCKMYPKASGSCHHFAEVARVLRLREIKYLGSTDRTKEDSYGMCCYASVNLCPAGGDPFVPELADEPCKTDADCNPDPRPFKWDGYCSQNSQESSCCRDETAMCPDGFTPYRNEPFCSDFNSVIVDSGSCDNPNGMCYKGHLSLDHNKLPKTHHSNYLTNAPCDPTKPLDIQYIWAYCDEKEEKVMVMGGRNWDGKELEWQKTRCDVTVIVAVGPPALIFVRIFIDFFSDCGHFKYLCVHKLYGLRYCVVNPLYKIDNNQGDLWNLTVAISSIFIGIIVVIVWTPTSVFK
ncbi:hypothetical protein B9Z55_006857 [Caenorhabditis nigoni]|uniref:Domain of unknown function DX domain-containing protein n=1 Tax=Caenorhabditis nigoni TaxID=1611254 RepID=A0A2G5V734_9PELO|nr:hypothetical protein B9Z55_006857 [Caenorhabditis nigoni]